MLCPFCPKKLFPKVIFEKYVLQGILSDSLKILDHFLITDYFKFQGLKVWAIA